jgi:hypothetical protein
MLDLVVLAYSDGSVSALAYEIGNQYVYASNLTPVYMQNETIKYRIPINTSRLTSKLVAIITDDGAMILMTDSDNNIKIVGQSRPNVINETLQTFKKLKVPELELPPFNPRIYDILRFQIRATIISNIFSVIVSIGLSPGYPTLLEEELPFISQDLHPSYEILLRQLYHLPIETPDNLILFSQLSSIQIARYEIDPLLQPYANSPNNIITIFAKNGTTYLVKARYDQTNNRIFSPV